jgi:hypothetical protein
MRQEILGRDEILGRFPTPGRTHSSKAQSFARSPGYRDLVRRAAGGDQGARRTLREHDISLGREEIMGAFVGEEERELAREGGACERTALARRTSGTSSGYNSAWAHVRGVESKDVWELLKQEWKKPYPILIDRSDALQAKAMGKTVYGIPFKEVLERGIVDGKVRLTDAGERIFLLREIILRSSPSASSGEERQVAREALEELRERARAGDERARRALEKIGRTRTDGDDGASTDLETNLDPTLKQLRTYFSKNGISSGISVGRDGRQSIDVSTFDKPTTPHTKLEYTLYWNPKHNGIVVDREMRRFLGDTTKLLDRSSVTVSAEHFLHAGKLAVEGLLQFRSNPPISGDVGAEKSFDDGVLTPRFMRTAEKIQPSERRELGKLAAIKRRAAGGDASAKKKVEQIKRQIGALVNRARGGDASAARAVQILEDSELFGSPVKMTI